MPVQTNEIKCAAKHQMYIFLSLEIWMVGEFAAVVVVVVGRALK